MYLTPRETDKLMLHLAGQVAMERKARGLKLNYPEAISLYQRTASGTGKRRTQRCRADADGTTDADR